MAKKMSKDTKILIGAAALAALVLFTSPGSSGGGGGWADGNEKLKKTVEEVPASVADTGIGQAFQDAPITAVFDIYKEPAGPAISSKKSFSPVYDLYSSPAGQPESLRFFENTDTGIQDAFGFKGKWTAKTSPVNIAQLSNINWSAMKSPVQASPTQYIKKVASQPTYKSGGGVTLVKKSAGMIGNRRNTVSIISRGGYSY